MRGHFREGYYVYNDRIDSHELAGFIKKGGNLRLVLVRNAGHSVPTNQPLWALRNRVTTWEIKNISHQMFINENHDIAFVMSSSTLADPGLKSGI